MLASALEVDARSGNEVADDARDEYFADPCSRWTNPLVVDVAGGATGVVFAGIADNWPGALCARRASTMGRH